MPDPTVSEVLAEHRYFVGVTWDRCSCLQRFQSRAEHDAHVEAMLRAAGLLAEDGETVTWYGVRDITSGDVPPDSLSTERKWCDTYLAEGADDLAAPEQVVARTVTTFPPRVTPWTEVTE